MGARSRGPQLQILGCTSDGLDGPSAKADFPKFSRAARAGKSSIKFSKILTWAKRRHVKPNEGEDEKANPVLFSIEVYRRGARAPRTVNDHHTDSVDHTIEFASTHTWSVQTEEIRPSNRSNNTNVPVGSSAAMPHIARPPKRRAGPAPPAASTVAASALSTE